MRPRRVIFEDRDADRIYKAARAGKMALPPKEQMALLTSLKRLDALRANMKQSGTTEILLVKQADALRPLQDPDYFE